ncbi:hypothetical protein GGX14DRAFT_387654 [Mycena pura]|uniref:Uncharacterized protein n=1 Tax=Mycena pura TaxID=153505 RepID=A0AAD7E298_9AGAR|nr:hypothetical protein GGX14DRAFT_387654 [Mycena pura]
MSGGRRSLGNPTHATQGPAFYELLVVPTFTPELTQANATDKCCRLNTWGVPPMGLLSCFVIQCTFIKGNEEICVEILCHFGLPKCTEHVILFNRFLGELLSAQLKINKGAAESGK